MMKGRHDQQPPNLLADQLAAYRRALAGAAPGALRGHRQGVDGDFSSRERTEAEYRDLLQQAGLELITITPTASPFSIIEAASA